MAADPRRIEAKKLSLEQGLTQAAIAQQLSVSTRTIERWASEDGWGARKKAQSKVVLISEAKPKPQPSLQAAPASTHSNPPSTRPRRQRGEIDELEIVEGAIANLSLLLGDTDRDCMENEYGRVKPIDTRGIGGIAGALVRLLEYRRKIQPPTAADLAEQVIALGISPSEFVAELKQRWQLQQRA